MEALLHLNMVSLLSKSVEYLFLVGINFEETLETFSLVAHLETIRLLLALATHLSLPVFQFDVIF